MAAAGLDPGIDPAIRVFHLSHGEENRLFEADSGHRVSVAIAGWNEPLGRRNKPGRVEETRELVIPRTPYIVAYAVIEDQVMILSVMELAALDAEDAKESEKQSPDAKIAEETLRPRCFHGARSAQ